MSDKKIEDATTVYGCGLAFLAVAEVAASVGVGFAFGAGAGFLTFAALCAAGGAMLIAIVRAYERKKGE